MRKFTVCEMENKSTRESNVDSKAKRLAFLENQHMRAFLPHVCGKTWRVLFSLADLVKRHI